MDRAEKLVKANNPQLDSIRPLLNGLPKVKGRSHIKPMLETRMYRGKRRVLVGYTWSRPASTFYGRVYDCVLGYGDSFEEAFKMAEEKAAMLKRNHAA